jgi:hypothetical protein
VGAVVHDCEVAGSVNISGGCGLSEARATSRAALNPHPSAFGRDIDCATPHFACPFQRRLKVLEHGYCVSLLRTHVGRMHSASHEQGRGTSVPTHKTRKHTVTDGVKRLAHTLMSSHYFVMAVQSKDFRGPAIKPELEADVKNLLRTLDRAMAGQGKLFSKARPSDVQPAAKEPSRHRTKVHIIDGNSISGQETKGLV